MHKILLHCNMSYNSEVHELSVIIFTYVPTSVCCTMSTSNWHAFPAY